MAFHMWFDDGTTTLFSIKHSPYRRCESSKLLYPERACTQARQAQAGFESPPVFSFPYFFDQFSDYPTWASVQVHWRSRSSAEEVLARYEQVVRRPWSSLTRDHESGLYRCCLGA